MLRLGFQPLLSSVIFRYFLLKSDGVLRLENRLPKRHGGSNPSSCANKNGLLLVGRPIFIATVRGDELPFAKRNGEFAYRRRRAYHEEQTLRGICVARSCLPRVELCGTFSTIFTPSSIPLFQANYDHIKRYRKKK